MGNIATIIGLLANLCGVILLFAFGLPYRLRTGGTRNAIAGSSGTNELGRERRSLLGWLGLFLIVLGTILQIVGTAWQGAAAT